MYVREGGLEGSEGRNISGTDRQEDFRPAACILAPAPGFRLPGVCPEIPSLGSGWTIFLGPFESPEYLWFGTNSWRCSPKPRAMFQPGIEEAPQVALWGVIGSELG